MFEEEEEFKSLTQLFQQLNSESPTYRIEREYSGVYSLFYAVLERAVQDYVGVTDPQDNETIDNIKLTARNWFESNEAGSHSHFTFLFVCEALDLSPLTIRKLIFSNEGKTLRNPKSGGKLKSRTSRNHKILNEILELY